MTACMCVCVCVCVPGSFICIGMKVRVEGVCCVRTCEDRRYFKSFQSSDIGRQKDEMTEIMEERSIPLE